MQDYILKSHDIAVLSFGYAPGDGVDLHEVFQPELVPVRLRGRLDSARFGSWLHNRVTPHGARIVRRIQKACGLDPRDTTGFLLHTHGLSLNDTFWLDTSTSALAWKDVSLYSNPFPADIAEIAFSGGIGSSPTGENSPEYTSGGNMKKCWERREKGIFLLKTDRRPELESEVYAEWFASQVLDAIGLPHVCYDLEYRSSRRRERSSLACVCPIFTSEDVGFVDAASLSKYWDLVRSGERNIRFELGTVSWQTQMAECFSIDPYADMMVVDFLLGNKDRHLGNFGWLVDNRTGELLGPAPLFDHGQSFFAAKDFREEDRDNIGAWIEAEADFSRYMDTWDILETFVAPRHADWLEKLKHFELRNHPDIPVSQDALRCMDTFLKCQLQTMAEVLEQKLFQVPSP